MASKAGLVAPAIIGFVVEIRLVWLVSLSGDEVL